MPKKQPKKDKNILQQSADGYVQMYHMGKRMANKVGGLIKKRVKK